MDLMVAMIEYPLIKEIVRTLTRYDVEQEPTIEDMGTLSDGRAYAILRFSTIGSTARAHLTLHHVGYRVAMVSNRILRVWRHEYQDDTICACGMGPSGCLELAKAQ
jgi:hypothetical protein